MLEAMNKYLTSPPPKVDQSYTTQVVSSIDSRFIVDDKNSMNNQIHSLTEGLNPVLLTMYKFLDQEEVCGALVQNGDIAYLIRYMQAAEKRGIEYNKKIGIQPEGLIHNCHIRGKLEKINKVCSMCETHNNVSYCYDECGYCNEMRKRFERAETAMDVTRYKQVIKSELVEQREKRETYEPSISNPGKEIFNRANNFIDRFIAVTYTVADTDMRRYNRIQLEDQLISNFKLMTQRDNMPCKGWIYVIEYTKALVPHLHGLVRLSTDLLKNKSVTISNGHFAGKNKITVDGTTYLRSEKLELLKQPANVKAWIDYIKKERPVVGDISGILQGWG